MLIPLLAGAALLAACGRPEDQETGSISGDEVLRARADMPPALAAALDSGNAAYRDEDYTAALRHYRAAVELEPDLAAAWFGVYMAQLALGNLDAADSAMQRARELAPGATLLHPPQPEPEP